MSVLLRRLLRRVNSGCRSTSLAITSHSSSNSSDQILKSPRLLRARKSRLVRARTSGMCLHPRKKLSDKSFCPSDTAITILSLKPWNYILPNIWLWRRKLDQKGRRYWDNISPVATNSKKKCNHCCPINPFLMAGVQQTESCPQIPLSGSYSLSNFYCHLQGKKRSNSSFHDTLVTQ